MLRRLSLGAKVGARKRSKMWLEGKAVAETKTGKEPPARHAAARLSLTATECSNALSERVKPFLTSPRIPREKHCRAKVRWSASHRFQPAGKPVPPTGTRGIPNLRRPRRNAYSAMEGRLPPGRN